MIDIWTSPNYLPFLGITAHWIDEEWSLRHLVIGFIRLTRPHTGENIAKAFMKCLKELGIVTKVSKSFKIK